MTAVSRLIEVIIRPVVALVGKRAVIWKIASYVSLRHGSTLKNSLQSGRLSRCDGRGAAASGDDGGGGGGSSFGLRCSVLTRAIMCLFFCSFPLSSSSFCASSRPGNVSPERMYKIYYEFLIYKPCIKQSYDSNILFKRKKKVEH